IISSTTAGWLAANRAGKPMPEALRVRGRETADRTRSLVGVRGPAVASRGMELEGRIALVTGAASGIGRATAVRPPPARMRVCCVDRDLDGARRVADDVGGTAFGADVSRAAETDAAFAACTDALGGVDLAYLNAGIAIARSDVAELEDDEYERILGVNVNG